MQYKITEIEFDLTGDCREYIDPEILQHQLQKGYIGKVLNVNQEDELVDLISDKSGWCVNAIQYEKV